MGLLPVLAVIQAARLYAVPLIDYEREDAYGVLVSSGCGIMMAVMDASPCLRWCVDADRLRGNPRARIADFLYCASLTADPVVVCGWFSYTDPTELTAAIWKMPIPPLVYGGAHRFGHGREARSLRELLSMLNGPRSLTPRAMRAVLPAEELQGAAR